MNVYTCTQFTGHWPVGSAAVVVADSPEKAAQLLNAKLREEGLKGDAAPFEMKAVPITAGFVDVLCNGDY